MDDVEVLKGIYMEAFEYLDCIVNDKQDIATKLNIDIKDVDKDELDNYKNHLIHTMSSVKEQLTGQGFKDIADALPQL